MRHVLIRAAIVGSGAQDDALVEALADALAR